ncbi:MAG: NYN domain-containing protein [Pseudoramibacter sp.]
MNGDQPTLIVDGYNVIYERASEANRPVGDLEDERKWLIDTLADYSGYRGIDTVLVFDAYNRKDFEQRELTISGISVIFTPFGETADSFIEGLVYAIMGSHREERKYRRNLRVEVVSSDNAVQQVVLGGGATRMSSRELLIDIKNVKKRAKAAHHEKPAQPHHNHLRDQMAGDVRDILDAMRKSDIKENK